MAKPLIEVLMLRDNLSRKEAQELINEAKDTLHSLIDIGNLDEAYEICGDTFGLEPDYLMDLV